MIVAKIWAGRFWACALAVVVFAPLQAVAAADCAEYGMLAVNQQKENLELACGFSGLRWHEDGAAHSGFCSLVGASAAADETAFRESKLAACRQARDAGNDAAEPVDDVQVNNCRRSEIAEGKGATTREARDNAMDLLGLARAQMINSGFSQCQYYELGCSGSDGDQTCWRSVGCCTN